MAKLRPREEDRISGSPTAAEKDLLGQNLLPGLGSLSRDGLYAWDSQI